MTKHGQLGKFKQQYCPDEEQQDELASTDSDGGQDDAPSYATKSRPSKSTQADPETIPSPCNPSFHEIYGVETPELATTNGKVTRYTNLTKPSIHPKSKSKSKSEQQKAVLRSDQKTPSKPRPLLPDGSAETGIASARAKRALKITPITSSPINNDTPAEPKSGESVDASSLEIEPISSLSEPGWTTESCTDSLNSDHSIATPITPEVRATARGNGVSHLRPFLTVLGRMINILLTFLENVVQNKHVVMMVGMMVVVWVLLWQLKSFFHPILDPLDHIFDNMGDGLHYTLRSVGKLGEIARRLFPNITVSQVGSFVEPALVSLGDIWSSAFDSLDSMLKSTRHLGGFAYQCFTHVKESMVNCNNSSIAGNHTIASSAHGSILCASSLTWWLASWLRISCAPATAAAGTFVFDALNSTAVELGHWASVSEALIPHINAFQLATIPLNRHRKVIEMNEVTFKAKGRLVDEIRHYSEGLYDTGSSIYNVTLASDRLLKVMIYSLQDVVAALQVAQDTDFGWWKAPKKKVRRVRGILSELLLVIDEELLLLIREIQATVDLLVETGRHGEQFQALTIKGQKDVRDQIQEKRGLWSKPDESLSRINQQLLATMQLPTDDILALLADSKIRLDRHRMNVQSAKTTLQVSFGLSDHAGLNPLLSLLRDTLGGLSNVKGKLALAQTEERQQFDQQLRNGLIKAPPL